MVRNNALQHAYLHMIPIVGEALEPAVRTWRALPGVARGTVLVLTGGFCGSSMGGFIHFVSEDMHAFEIVFFRNLFALMFFVPTLIRHNFRPLHTKRLNLHLLRGSVQAVAMIGMFWAISLSPLAKVTSMQFTAPLFATVLAVLILGEVVRMRRMVALAVGFGGAVIVLQPWTGEYDTGAVVALCSAACFSVVMILVRRLGTSETSSTQIIYMGLVTTPVSFLAAMTVWQTPTVTQLAWICLIGLLGTLSNLCLAQALRETELTAVLPVQFTKLIWAAAIGYIFFAEIPDAYTWIGGTVIFASATYIGLREHKLARERRAKEKAEGAASAAEPAPKPPGAKAAE